MDEPGIGIQIGATTPPVRLAAIAGEAEQLGYNEIWLAEDYFELGGVASVGVALAATETVAVGLGVVAGPVRHPAVSAMEFATLADAYPERFMAGIGHGAPGWVRQMGLQPASAMGSLREVVGATRELLDGREITRKGEYFGFDRVRLLHPPRQTVPLYLGVHGPASLRLSGELADGTLLGWFSSPGYVAWARERIEEGREGAERTGSHALVALCVLSINDDDPAGARTQVADWAAPMLVQLANSPQLAFSSDGDDLARYVAGDANLPDDLLGRFVAAGDRESCRATVRGLLDAGADRVVLVPNPAALRSTDDMVEQIRRASTLLQERDRD